MWLQNTNLSLWTVALYHQSLGENIWFVILYNWHWFIHSFIHAVSIYWAPSMCQRTNLGGIVCNLVREIHTLTKKYKTFQIVIEFEKVQDACLYSITNFLSKGNGNVWYFVTSLRFWIVWLEVGKINTYHLSMEKVWLLRMLQVKHEKTKEHPKHCIQREREQEWNLESMVRSRRQGEIQPQKDSLNKIYTLGGNVEPAIKPVLRRSWLRS